MWCRILNGGEKNDFFQGPKDQERAEAQGNTRSPLQLEGTDRPTKGNDRSGPLQLSGTTVPALSYSHAFSSSHGTTGPKSRPTFAIFSCTLCNTVHFQYSLDVEFYVD